jgi:arylsulfatase A-like enzyme
MSEKPNILFINTDQQTYDAISAYDNAWIKTPNMDALVEQGTSFTRSYCTDPVCASARTSWYTGLFSSETGVTFNGGHLHEDIADIGQILNNGGYQAFHSGKWHVDGRDVKKSFKTLYYGNVRIGAGGGEYYDSMITNTALEFLTTYKGADPFYLQLGYINPHDVCEYGHAYEEKEIPDPIAQGILQASDLPPFPSNFDYDERETVLHRVMRRDDESVIHWPILQKARHFSELQWRYFAWALYRFVEKVDAEIGLVLSALEASSFKDNTLIIFTADHGEAAGRHQMFQKFSPYEESIRTPLIIASLGNSIPINKGSSTNALVSGLDLPATICDYANLALPEGTHGRSLKPLVESQTTPWRDFLYTEFNYWGRVLMNDQYKYVTEYKPKEVEDYIPPGPDNAEYGLEQLFDLKSDPLETHNLAEDAPHQDAKKIMSATLAEHERTLTRRPLLPGSPRNTVDKWGERLRQRWASFS